MALPIFYRALKRDKVSGEILERPLPTTKRQHGFDHEHSNFNVNVGKAKETPKSEK